MPDRSLTEEEWVAHCNGLVDRIMRLEDRVKFLQELAADRAEELEAYYDATRYIYGG